MGREESGESVEVKTKEFKKDTHIIAVNNNNRLFLTVY